MDNIKIASTGQATLIKTIAAIGIIGAGSFGIYFWLDNKETPDKNIAGQSEQVSERTTDIVTSDEKLAVETETIESVEEGVEGSKEVENNIVDEVTDTEIPDVSIPVVEEPETDSTIESDDDLKSPLTGSESTIGLSTRTDVELVMSKKYKFHYQSKDGKLVLYGDFEDVPFEIIELKSNNRLITYLFYKDNFFELKEDSEEIRPLEAVSDKKLIEELQKRR